MTTEQLEFEISQYADGTLPPASRAALESRLASDARARALLDEYRKLDAAFASARPIPALNWDRLATAISAAVADQAGAEESRRAAAYRMPWVGALRGLAIAASLLIAFGLAVAVLHHRPAPNVSVNVSPKSTPTGHAVVSVAITGPETAPAAAVVQIDLQPAGASDASWRYAQGVVARPSRVVIASGIDTSPDMPYFR